MKNTPENAIQQQVELGKDYKAKNMFDEAEKVFKGIIKAHPDREDAHFELANVYNAKQMSDLSACEYEKTLEINKDNDIALTELAKIYWSRGKHEEAIKSLEKAVKLNYNNVQAHLELGKIYRVLGNYVLSKQELTAVAGFNKENSIKNWLQRIDAVKGARKEMPPYRVFITWGMLYECNFRCSYCYTPKPEEKDFNKNEKHKAVYPKTEEMIEIWKNIADTYGPCRIRLDGGEPSCYPDFIRLVKEMSKLHFLQINTNLSFDVDPFIKNIDPASVRVDASFHPEFMPVDEFISKLNKLKENGFKTAAALVAYPPAISKIEFYKKKLGELNIPFIIHPFSGFYNSKKYPVDYTADENKIIYGLDKKSEVESEWRKDNDNTQIKPQKLTNKCLMGHMYARIYPNGQGFRCCTDDGLLSLGNIFKGDFRLLDKPEPCDNSNCRCWRCMRITEETRWLPTWLDDWEMPF